jgi:hypothetical protein
LSTEKSPRNKPSEFLALKALKRAARKAIELARQTGTPAYVMENGKTIDAARQPGGQRKKKTAPLKRTHRS